MRMLKKKISFCQKALSIEIGFQKSFGKNFEEELSALRFPLRLEILFRKWMIRHWIYQKKWKKASKCCNLFLHRFPWIDSFYQLRAFAKIYAEKYKEAISDTLKAIKLNPSNITAFANISDLLLDKAQYSLLYQLFAEYEVQNVRTIHEFYQRFLKIYLPKLRKAFSRKKVSYPKNWEKLINFAMKTDRARGLIEKMISFQNQKAIRYLEKLSKSSNSKYKIKALFILLHLSGERSRFERQKIKEILIRYSALAQRIYVLEIRKMGSKGISYLLEILRDKKEEKILRFLAAQMLINLCHLDAFDCLIRVANNKKFSIPTNLLVHFAMRKKGIYLPFAPFLAGKILKLPTFYRIFYCFFVQEKDSLIDLQKLLYDKDPIVSIAAAYNLRRVSNDQKILNQLDQRLLSLMKHKNLRARDFSLHCFWKHHNRKLKEDGRKRIPNLQHIQGQKYFRSYLKSYGKIICKALKDPSPEIKLTAFRIILGNFGGFWGNNSSLEIQNQLYKMAQDKVFGKLSLIALALIGDFQKLSPFLEKSELWFLDLFVLRFSLFRIKNGMNILHFMKKRFSSPCKTEKIRKFRQAYLPLHEKNFSCPSLFQHFSNFRERHSLLFRSKFKK